MIGENAPFWGLIDSGEICKAFTGLGCCAGVLLRDANPEEVQSYCPDRPGGFQPETCPFPTWFNTDPHIPDVPTLKQDFCMNCQGGDTSDPSWIAHCHWPAGMVCERNMALEYCHAEECHEYEYGRPEEQAKCHEVVQSTAERVCADGTDGGLGVTMHDFCANCHGYGENWTGICPYVAGEICEKHPDFSYCGSPACDDYDNLPERQREQCHDAVRNTAQRRCQPQYTIDDFCANCHGYSENWTDACPDIAGSLCDEGREMFYCQAPQCQDYHDLPPFQKEKCHEAVRRTARARCDNTCVECGHGGRRLNFMSELPCC